MPITYATLLIYSGPFSEELPPCNETLSQFICVNDKSKKELKREGTCMVNQLTYKNKQARKKNMLSMCLVRDNYIKVLHL